MVSWRLATVLLDEIRTGGSEILRIVYFMTFATGAWNARAQRGAPIRVHPDLGGNGVMQ